MLMINYFKSNQNKRMERISEYGQDCWVDMINPSDDEIEDVASFTGVSEEFLKAALDEEETARVERDEGVFMCLLDTPIITDTDDGDTYETIPMALIYNEKCVVTVSLRGNPVLGDFISNRVIADTRKPVSFILTFMLGNAKRFLANLRQIEKKSLRVQAELHRSMKNKELIQLLTLENSLVYFSTSLSANISAQSKLERLPAVMGTEEYRELYDDVMIEMRQATEMCNIYRDILSGTMDAYASVISNNVNIVMKLLTVITVIFTIPTLIASLWGMNVIVPFEDTVMGFWVVIGIAIAFTAVASVLIVRSTNSIRIRSPKTVKRRRRERNEEK